MEENIAQKATLAEEALPIGTTLSDGQFTITGYLGAGGFGITYRAKDNVLGRAIVIKECFPADFCARRGTDVSPRNSTYQKQVSAIVRMFMREARSLAKLRHPNIVGVHRAFEENNTAYMVIDLIDGEDLHDLVEKTPLSPARIKSILVQLLDAIDKVHEIDLLHRDISPDNIIIGKDGNPVLIDFGAARADASRHSRGVTSFLVVKDGYSPPEFYVGRNQTPSSDLYSLAATFYFVLARQHPIHSQTRLVEIAANKPDPLPALADTVEGYEREFLEAIDQAMKIHPNERIQTAARWKSLIPGAELEEIADVDPSSRQNVSLDLELTLTRLIAETNDEVQRASQPKIVSVAAEPQSKEPSRPKWVEEFNQDSLVEDENQDTAESLDDEAENVFDIRSDEAPSSPAPMAKVETNWIGLAREKEQERIQRLENEYGLFNDEAIEMIPEFGDRDATAPTNPKLAEPSEDTPQPTPADDQPPGFRPMRLLTGLALCACVAFLVQFV